MFVKTVPEPCRYHAFTPTYRLTPLSPLQFTQYAVSQYVIGSGVVPNPATTPLPPRYNPATTISLS